MFDDINKVILIGRLGADPEIKYISDGIIVLSFNIATSLSRKDFSTGNFSKKTEWHRAVVYGNFAETIRDYLKKGIRVYLEGSFRTVKTKNRDYVEIIVSTIRLLSNEFKNDHVNSFDANSNKNNKDDLPF